MRCELSVEFIEVKRAYVIGLMDYEERNSIGSGCFAGMEGKYSFLHFMICDGWPFYQPFRWWWLLMLVLW